MDVEMRQLELWDVCERFDDTTVVFSGKRHLVQENEEGEARGQNNGS